MRRFTINKKPTEEHPEVEIIAKGVRFENDGLVVLRWFTGEQPTAVIWSDMASVEKAFENNEDTTIEWIDYDHLNDGGTVDGHPTRVDTDVD